MQASPTLPSDPLKCPSGFNAFLDHLETLAQQYAKPVVLAHGDDHFFFVDQPLTQTCSFRDVQTFGETQVHWVKVHCGSKVERGVQHRAEDCQVQSLAASQHAVEIVWPGVLHANRRLIHLPTTC